MIGGSRRTASCLWLTIPIAVLLALAAGAGVFIDTLYRDAPSFAAQAVGQDLISFAVVLPILIASALLAGHGSFRARLVWTGALMYLVYTSIIAAFDLRFNALFLVYVGVLGFSLYALIGGLGSVDKAEIKVRFAEKTPVKTVSIYLAALAVLFYLLWLSEIVPATIAGETPQSVRDNGTPTNAVQVLDMAGVLPALGITAVRLWQKRASGYTLAGAMLTYVVLLSLAILSMVLSMVRAGIPVVIPQVVIFALLFLTSMGFLVWYLKGLQSLSDGAAIALRDKVPGAALGVE